MNTSSVNVSDSPTPANLFDEFEEAYQNCLAPLTKEDNLNSNTIQEELRANAEMNALKFLDLARQMEAFFLQKRYLLAVQKPELILMEEISEMKNEIARKDELIKRHGDKLSNWQNQLMNLQSRSGTLPSVGPRTSLSSSSSHTVGMISTSNPPVSSQVAMPGLSPVSGTTMSSGSMGHTGPSVSHSMNPNMGMTVGQSSIVGQVGGNMATSMGSMVGMGQGGYQSNMGMPSGHSGMQSGPGGMSSMSSGGSGMPGPGGVGSGMGSSGGSMGMTSTSGTMQTGMGMYPGGAMSQAHGGGLQGPLAFLEKTTTNIGMPEPRR